jgi:hypothetical protein
VSRNAKRLSRSRLVELEQNPIVQVPLPRARLRRRERRVTLAYALATGWPSAGLFSDEAGAVIGSSRAQ